MVCCCQFVLCIILLHHFNFFPLHFKNLGNQSTLHTNIIIVIMLQRLQTALSKNSRYTRLPARDNDKRRQIVSTGRPGIAIKRRS